MAFFQTVAVDGEAVEREALKQAAIQDTSIFHSDALSNRRTQFNRALSGLLETGYLCKTGDAIHQALPRVEVDVDTDFDNLDSQSVDE
jgi:hypothetical protein